MELDNLPALVIPCEDLQALHDLLNLLFENDILTDESFRFLNVPENVNEILNTKNFFEPVEIGGIKTIKGLTERCTKDLL